MCLSLVVPVHDREATITEEIWALAQAASQCHPDWELVIVDRGSRDRTPEILERLRHHEPRLNLVYQCRMKGYGEALRSGLLHARGEFLVVMDRPGGWVLADMIRWVGDLEVSDLVAGYRRKGPRPAWDLISAWIFRNLLRLPTDCRNAGVWVFRRALLQRVGFTLAGREALWEFAAQAVRQGSVLQTVPVPFFPHPLEAHQPLGPDWRTALQLAWLVLRSRPEPLFTPVHEASTAQLRVAFLAGQDRMPEGRLSLEH
ncbi:MAG: glycosyltransferase family 2 protein [Candidatus Methylacidiphilales bacterium]|nr:glycosyltransferase family 2 protein [Candidatus Methylacidiphilales bacterium]